MNEVNSQFDRSPAYYCNLDKTQWVAHSFVIGNLSIDVKYSLLNCSSLCEVNKLGLLKMQ